MSSHEFILESVLVMCHVRNALELGHDWIAILKMYMSM
jgi:hypothetical protein